MVVMHVGGVGSVQEALTGNTLRCSKLLASQYLRGFAFRLRFAREEMVAYLNVSWPPL